MPDCHIDPETFQKSWPEIRMRYALVRIRSLVGDKFFYFLSGQLKKVRAFFRGTRSNIEMLMNDDESGHTSSELLVCITHDIDSYSCSVNLEKLFEITDNFKISTTVNVLTDGPYDLRDLLTRIPNHHEIGLHGDTHDIAFGFRSIIEINNRLDMCLKKLSPLVINSYRAPGLGISKNLIDSLEKHGIKVDSSFVSMPLFKGDIKPTLHSVSTGKVTEVPLVLSDDLLFREIGLTDKQTDDLVLKLSNRVADLRGIFVLNFHPGVTINRIETYRRVVNTLANRPNTKFVTISGAVQLSSSK